MTIIIRNIAPKYIQAWREWGELFCRIANFDTLTIDPLVERPKDSAMMIIPMPSSILDIDRNNKT